MTTARQRLGRSSSLTLNATITNTGSTAWLESEVPAGFSLAAGRSDSENPILQCSALDPTS